MKDIKATTIVHNWIEMKNTYLLEKEMAAKMDGDKPAHLTDEQWETWKETGKKILQNLSR